MKKSILIINLLLFFCMSLPLASCGKNDNHLVPNNGASVQKIKSRGVLLVGTTGDYRPLTFKDTDGSYWGFCIEIAELIAQKMNVKIQYIPTSWPTLSNDVLADSQTFDFAIGGITITDQRKEKMLMSDGYLVNGKTILCRTEDSSKYLTLADMDKPEVKVMVNPGGLNEKFAHDFLSHSTIIVHQKNEEIPELIAEGDADIMVTEITEAPYYVSHDKRLAAPLLNMPFTNGYIGVLMRKGQEDLLDIVNETIKEMKTDGTLRQLHEKYNLIYSF